MNAQVMTDALMRGVNDAANLGFVVKQTSHVESQVIEMEYPEIRYAQDVPIDTSANPFVKSVTFYSMDKVGRAKVINGRGDDIPLANAELLQHETEVTMAGIGYGFSLEEVGQAMMLGMNLDSMGAEAANYSYEKFMDDVAFIGFSGTAGGLYNYSGITTVAAGGVWTGRTPQQILADFNAMITGPYAATNGVEIPNTIRLPIAVMGYITTTQLSPENQMTILQFVQANNVYTAQTGQPLDIRGDYRLTTKAVSYHKSERVLKMHVPMPLRFLPVQTRNLEYVVPGMFRTGGLDIRRPGAVRYLTGVAS